MDTEDNREVKNEARKFALAEVQKCRYSASKYASAEIPPVFDWKWMSRFDEIREYLVSEYGNDLSHLISLSLRCFFYVGHYWAEYERQTLTATGQKTRQDGVSLPGSNLDKDDADCQIWNEHFEPSFDADDERRRAYR